LIVVLNTEGIDSHFRYCYNCVEVGEQLEDAHRIEEVELQLEIWTELRLYV